jgi:hypothetical protein
MEEIYQVVCLCSLWVGFIGGEFRCCLEICGEKLMRENVEAVQFLLVFCEQLLRFLNEFLAFEADRMLEA